MKLASILLPVADVDTRAKKRGQLDAGHSAIKLELRAKYKGYTRYDARGVWADPSGNIIAENVTRYDFAAEDRRTVEDDVRALAYKIKTITDEQSIMVVHTNGKVEFI